VKTTDAWRKTLSGALVALLLLLALSALMLALRSHLSIATVGLVLVVPVVVGVVAGGALAGAITMLAGVLVYDLVFIPPYGTLSVGEPQDWVVMVVYLAVMALVTRVANGLTRAESVARARTEEAERMFAVSELLVSERPVAELLEVIVSTVAEQFDARSVVLLLPRSGRLEPVATAGEPLAADEVERLTPAGGVVSSFRTWHGADGRWRGRGGTRTVALSASGRPVGLLALTGLGPPFPTPELLSTFANHVALALERAQLREQAVRMDVLEEVDRLRRALLGTVSHDLRTPLATIKASSSALLDPSVPLGANEERELLELIEAQTDRLTRRVSNLLDMSRIQSGALVPDSAPIDVAKLVSEALAVLGPAATARVSVVLPVGLPPAEVDHVLIEEAVANLVENALRFGPEATKVLVDAVAPLGAGQSVTIRVRDEGPGIAPEAREHIFERAERPERPERPGLGTPRAGGGSGGTGLGLAIVKSFVEAHGGRCWAEDPATGGARFCIEVPAAVEAG
jgi:two-component system sensor histidine kinase KdpD